MLTLERPGIGLSDPQPGPNAARLATRRRRIRRRDATRSIRRAGNLSQDLRTGQRPHAPRSGRRSRSAMRRLPPGARPVTRRPDQRRMAAPDPAIPGAAPTGPGRGPRTPRTAARRWATRPARPLRGDARRAAEGDRQAYEQFRSYWMRILAATYGQTPSTDEYRIMYEPWLRSGRRGRPDPRLARRRRPSRPAGTRTAAPRETGGTQRTSHRLPRRRPLPHVRPPPRNLGAVDRAAQLPWPAGDRVARQLDDGLPDPGPPRPQTSAHGTKSRTKIVGWILDGHPECQRYRTAQQVTHGR